MARILIQATLTAQVRLHQRPHLTRVNNSDVIIVRVHNGISLEELDPATEAAGLGLSPPSIGFPILQTYVDVVLNGCLEHGEASVSSHMT
jgi:hypothetical protein